jgi:hypothetical protein
MYSAVLEDAACIDQMNARAITINMLKISKGVHAMKRSVLIVALLVLLVLVVVAIPAAAEEEIPPHPHMLLQRPEIDFATFTLVGVKQCVDLASNQALPLNSHHEHIHTGSTGVSFGGGESGHLVFPAAPLVPFWNNCEDLLASLPFSFPSGE